MMKLWLKGSQVSLWVLAVFVLGGCVTTQESVYTTDASPEDAANKRLELARRYIGDGDWANAERNLTQAARLTPDSPQVHEAFALVYQSTGEYELAEQNFKRALSLDKKFSRARNNYAAFLYQRGRYKEAEKQLETVVADTLYTGRPRAFVNLGIARLRLDDSEGAKKAFERALTMDRTNALAMIELAQIEYENQEYDAAQRMYVRYRGIVRRPDARALWLGVKIAHARGDADAEASHALALRNLYPQSAEYKAYEEAKARGEF